MCREGFGVEGLENKARYVQGWLWSGGTSEQG